ncbi:MAG: hypothetical protein JNK79_01805 [Chitinophagaceae bacterium]|nr:hypothetical protein [Chitinophagaceae bacterium]
MEQNKNSRFPEQDQPDKLAGTTGNDSQKEKYIRDSGKIEDLPSQDELAKMKAEPKGAGRNESSHLTDRSGEEKKEDYINTDERKKDLDNRGL